MSEAHTALLLMALAREERERREHRELMELRDRLRGEIRRREEAHRRNEHYAMQQQQYFSGQQQHYQYYGGHQQYFSGGHLQLGDDEDQAKHEAVPRTMKCPACDGVGKAWRLSRSFFHSHTYDYCAQCNGRGTLEVSVESPKLVARKHFPW
jgi:hypothetical protein